MVKYVASRYVDGRPETSVTQGARQFLRIHRVSLHHGLELSRGDIRRMGNHTGYAMTLKVIIGGKTTETGLIDGIVTTARIMSVQMFKELLAGGFLTVLALVARLGQYSHVPGLQVNVNSYINVLTFEIYSFTLCHRCNILNYDDLFDVQLQI